MSNCAFQDTVLYKKLATDADLLQSVLGLREKAKLLGETLIRDAQAFTDHTISHMDALWRVCNEILTQGEIDRMTTGEAFLLASGFYLHDIGMAYAATPQGRARLETTPEFRGLVGANPNPSNELRGRALANAVRVHHASAAIELAAGPIPGTTEFLIEPKSIREQFGTVCGQIAASHHWSIEKIESDLASQGRVPLPANREADLAFVACALRIIDYAHINRERAPRLQRVVRHPLPADSEAHWAAQENIDGPLRSDNELVYSATTPIKDVDAWWLIYEFATGLDNEIRQCGRLLKKRQVSQDRMSLIGVRGANAPQEFSRTVKTAGYLPLEVHVKASSITRLVRILAGESLYGKNFLAPIRELIQNARDAVLLKRTISTAAPDRAAAALPIELTFLTASSPATLQITDWGVGMTQEVITEHLITIASDYWESKFHTDYPNAHGFQPSGRFGIGFLSVFMLGEDIRVRSQRTGSESYQLTIRGLGRRAELRKAEAQVASGSTVSIELKPEATEALKDLPEALPTLIPMIEVPIKLTVDSVVKEIKPKWVLDASAYDFRRWVRTAAEKMTPQLARDYFSFRYKNPNDQYTIEQENRDWPLGAVEYVAEGVRLVADQFGRSILSLKGFSLQTVKTPGFAGVIDSADVTPDAARKQGLDIDLSGILAAAVTKSKEAVKATLSKRRELGFIPDQLDFASWVQATFGKATLLDSEFPWLQVIDRSGDARYVSTAELLVALQGKRAVYVGMNLSTGAVSGRWRHSSTTGGEAEIAVTFPAHIEYVREIERGSLTELHPDWPQIRFLKPFLEVLAREWNTTTDFLATEPQLTRTSNEIQGFLTPPAHSPT